jgi:hypothetical protein
MAFKTENRKISNIFEGQKIYTVPRYQRNYIWDKVNWNQLVEDVKFTLEQENNKKWSHFLGAIVLNKKNGEDSNLGIEEFEIIDGQQRLTTVFILFLAIFSKLKKINKNNIEEDYIDNTYIKIKKISGEVVFKFRNPKLDNDIEEIYQKIKDDEEIDEKSKIKKLFLFLEQKLDEYTSVEEIKQFLNSLLSVNVVEIISEEDEEIYNIFEVLNARGQKLKQMELLKNRVMKYIIPRDDDVIDKAKNSWEIIEQNFSTSKDIDTPLYQFIKCYIPQKADNKDSVYELIRSEIKIKNLKKFLEDLLEFSYSYKEIIDEGEKNTYIKYFEIKRNKQIRTLITVLYIKLYKKFNEPEKYNNVLNQLRNIFFIFNLTKQTSNKTEKIITDFSCKIYYSETLNETKIIITDLLLKLNEMISSTGNSIEMYLATNSSIKYSNKKESQFHRNSSLVKYILGEVYKNSHHDTEINIDSMTIEHLKSDDGSDETSQLSNLTLVTRELNEKLKNKPISEKIKILKENSDIIENKNLKGFLKKDKFVFEERLRWFSQKIINEVFKVNTSIFNITKEDIKKFQTNLENCKNEEELLKLIKETGTTFEQKLEKDPKLKELKIKYEKISKEQKNEIRK